MDTLLIVNSYSLPYEIKCQLGDKEEVKGQAYVLYAMVPGVGYGQNG